MFSKINVSIFFALLAAGCAGNNSTIPLPYYNTPDFTPVWDIDTCQSPLHTIPPFSFIDQNNKSVTEKTFDNKIYLANFFFTSCTVVCPVMTKNLLKVQQAFPANTDIAFLSFSVTPWRDSVPKLKEFSSRYQLDARWHLVTGDKGVIYKLARQSYFAEEQLGFYKDSTQFMHTEHILLIDKQRHIRGIYNGTLELEIDRMIDDIKTLQQ